MGVGKTEIETKDMLPSPVKELVLETIHNQTRAYHKSVNEAQNQLRFRMANQKLIDSSIFKRERGKTYIAELEKFAKNISDEIKRIPFAPYENCESDLIKIASDAIEKIYLHEDEVFKKTQIYGQSFAWIEYKTCYEHALKQAGTEIKIFVNGLRVKSNPAPIQSIQPITIIGNSNVVQSGKNQSYKKDESRNDEKPHWTVTPMFWVALFTLIAGIIVAVPVISDWAHPKLNESSKQVGDQKESQKLLPPKIIADPPQPAKPQAQQIDINDSKKFVTNDASDDGEKYYAEMQELRVQNQKKQDAADQTNQLIFSQTWGKSLPVFNQSLEILSNVLSKEAAKHGDRIVHSASYYKCIPTNMDMRIGTIDVATIGFERKDDVNFRIEIYEMDPSQRRKLTIYCPVGFVRMRHDSDDKFYSQLCVRDFPGGCVEEVVPYSESLALVKKQIMYLVVCQIASSFPSEPKNKSEGANP